MTQAKDGDKYITLAESKEGYNSSADHNIKIIASGIKAIRGLSQIFIVCSSAIKTIAIPASVERSAARGVIFLILSPTNAPSPSHRPLMNALITPTFQANSALPVFTNTGTMIKRKNANKLTVFIP